MKMSNEREIRSSDIAIIGMNCRVPGAKSPEEFWENLRSGKESVVFFDDQELRAAGVPQETLDDPHYVKARATLDNIDLFDASFFGFSPREAESLDPQHRLFMECAWELLERAGHGAPGAEDLVGIYAGIGTNNYVAGVLTHDGLTESLGRFSISMANDKDFLATNVSYKLNLRGPSVTVQTACSTSLVAVHMACQGIFSGECDMALAGGVSLDVPQKGGYLHKEGDILSPDGHCRAFDARAQGTVPASGVGVVLLKRLEDAVADGDYVHAVIRGSAINNDGSSKVGYTAPSIEGQARVIRAAQALAEVEAESISYVEAHGTGTSIGDPIEIAALTEAFRSSTGKKRFCAIGSVKTNLGHLNTAAGVVGLIKTILALEHRQIPPSLHFNDPNPKIDFESSPVYVNRKLQDWTGPLPLRAGVSSFGMGGTNAHVILEEAPEKSFSSKSGPSLLVLSAKTAGALKNAGMNLAEHLKKHEDASLADIAYTLQTGRKGFAHRQAIVCENRKQAIGALDGVEPEIVKSGVAPQSEPGVVFMFPGQGSQFVDMGRQLYASDSDFRKIVDECSERLKPVLGIDLRHIMYPAEDQRESAAEQLRQTGITQPATFVIEYALAKLWMKWGVRPQAMIGHSLGEYVAATIAGVITEEDALKLVAARGQLMQKMPRGSMLAVELSEEELFPRLNAELCLAGINGPRQTVVSGPSSAVDALEKQLNAEEIVCRRLQTSHAFHSHMMDPLLAHFFREVSSIQLRPPSIPFLSNLTGTWITPGEAIDPEYWVKHLREAVRFGPGILEIMKTPGERVFMEVGPGQALSGLARRILDAQSGARVVTSLPAPKKEQSEQTFLLDALSKLWLAGVSVNWRGVHAGEKRYRVPLPAYPFERQRYWVDPLPHANEAGRKQGSSGKKPDVGDWFYLPFWKPSVLPQSSRKPEAKQNWLVFTGEEGLGLDLARELGSAADNVVTVQPGERFLELDENTYSLRPQQQADYEELLTTLREQKRSPHRIVHLWNVNAETTAPGYWRFSNPSQHLGFYSLLFLAKTLHKQAAMEPTEIVVVSSNMQTVTGQENASPEKATLLGPCLSIPYEYPSVRCRSVDFMPAPSGTWQGERVLKQLMAELASESPDPMVAYRGLTRWVKKFEPTRLEKHEGHPTRLREKGVYLITGGLGQIGLELGEYLARSVRARLVLVATSAFPPQEQWDGLASHSDQDAVCRKIRKLQSMLGLGAEIWIAQGDAGNLQQMQKIVNAARERFGPIQGVIHAAGRVRSMRLIQETEPADCDLHFQSKARGLLVLEQVLRQEPLDFCVLFSSLATILGGAGYCAYSAANFFMDSLAQCRQHHSALAWTSVNWDGWNFIDHSAGSAASGSGTALLTMTPSQGVEAFHRILCLDPVAQILVSTGDLDARFKQLIHGQQSERPELKQDSASESLHSRPALGTAYVPPESETEIRISKIWQELLGIAQIGIHDNFFEMGGNSLMATQLLSRLRQAFSMAIPLETVFDNSTIGQLAKALTAYRRAAAARVQESPPAPVVAEPIIRLEDAAREKIQSPLARLTRPESLPLSFTQQRLWFINQLEGATPQYNLPEAMRLRGELDLEALDQAISAVVERHEILRTRFVETDGDPEQIIDSPAPIHVPLEDLSAFDRTEQEARVRAAQVRESEHPFDLVRGPLLRIRLLKLNEREHVLLRNFHHIVSDGWSQGIFNHELTTLYEAFHSGRKVSLEPLPIQYADFALWQRRLMDDEALDRHLQYWREQLSGIPDVLNLPTDHPRGTRQSFAGELCRFKFPAELVDALQRLGNSKRSTLYMTLLAAFAVLLHRYSGQDDIVLGTPIANRQDHQLEGLIGYFVNALVMRTRIEPEKSFADLLAQVRTTALEAFRQREIPFEQLTEILPPQRSLNTPPVFQVMFAHQNVPTKAHRMEGLEVEPMKAAMLQVRFDLEVVVSSDADAVELCWLYNRDLFDRWRMEQMSRQYQALLYAVTAAPAVPLTQISFLTQSERKQLLEEWNQTASEMPRERLVHQMFEAQAAKNPGALALECEDARLTYAELDQRANQLAHFIRKSGVAHEVKVGVCLERGPEMIVALLGVLKAGGAYVPLDSAYPDDRLGYVAKDSDIKVLLTLSSLQDRVAGFQGVTVELDREWAQISQESNRALDTKIYAENAAYVIYTSGSTGKPKGVTVEHRQLCNQLMWAGEALHVTAADRVLQKASFSFDASMLEIFLPLAWGAGIVVAKPRGETDAGYLVHLVIEKAVTYVDLVPSLLEALLEHPAIGGWTSLRVMSSGAETLQPELVSAFRQALPAASLWNTYGPTEATVQATFAPGLQAGQRVPIGTPVANTQTYVLDRRMEPAPIGVAGELYIGGAGVARGYWQRPELTAEKFVPNPFTSQPGDRLYRTGDLVRWMPDGNLEFEGRADHQVKIRGYRVELGEIEEALRSHEQVRDALVTLRDRSGQQQLLAYVIARESEAQAAGSDVSPDLPWNLQAHLRKFLPGYMVPSEVIVVPSWPRTPSGKIDRAALPLPERQDEKYRAPRGPLEQMLCEIVAGVLQLENVGIDDNFFSLGGHSLLAMRLVSRVRAIMGADLPIRALFETPTIAGLVPLLKNGDANLKPRMPQTPRERPLRLPLSHAQQRLWFINQLEENSTQYNIPDALRLRGHLDCEALERAINTIVARHEILRTRFDEIDGEPVQIIEPELRITLSLEDCSTLNHAAQEDKIGEAAGNELAQSFNLRTGPLLRVKLLKLGEQEYVLFRTFHHIVSDGWSHGIFTKELMVLYEAFREGRKNTLDPLPLQYADFALWQREFLDEEAVERELEYWKQKLKGIPEQLTLSHDRPRPARQTVAAEWSHATVPAETVAALKHLCQEKQATLYMTLLAVFALLLRRYSGQDDIVVGSPVANRQDARLEQLIGLFVNSLVMRMQIQKDKTFRELLASVRQSALEAYLHQDVPFEKLVEELSPQRSLNVTPIFQVLFAMQNAPVTIHRLQNLVFEPVQGAHSTVRTDLEVHAYEHSGQITLYWLYKRDLFDRWRIEQMARHYVRMLELVVANPDSPIHQLDPLTAAERHQILVEWNSKSAPFGPERTVAELFQHHVFRAPDAPALTFAAQSMSYAELHRRSNQLGHYLNELGIGPEVRVGACFERGPEMVIALLAIMKAGGTYVPLDVDFPAERLAYMIQDAACSVVLAEKKSRAILPAQVQVLAIDEDQEKIGAVSTDAPPCSAGPKNAAYVIYTSGSTGRPKGVVIEHRNVLHMVYAQREAFGVRETDTVLQFFSFSFDVSVFATLMALCAGARLVLGSREELLPGPGLLSLLESEAVTVGVLPPVVLDHLPEARLPKLRQIIVGGEPWSEDLLKTWGNGRRFFNSYGPTETTVQATVGECRAGEGKPSIGRPILNARIYLLDEDRKPVPTGVAGELYIGGNGVGRGYLDHALTAEKFIPDPFSERADARMYRTGDWALWLPDGRINLLGRKDEQVKIRGHRVELGEIESVLGQHPAVLQSAVLVRKTDGRETRLIAYAVLNPGRTAATAELRSYLKNKLPDYMVPAQFVLLPELPLNSSGKVDRHALPDVEAGASEGRAPRTPEEELLCQIFAEVLGLARVGIDDNFFDSGGHSLMATRLASRVRSMLGVELPLRALFESPTVAGLRPHLRQAEKARAPLVAAPRPERLPMSYAQQRLWFLDQLQGKSTEYNVPEALHLRGELDYSALERALSGIVQRHEILRTRFAEAEDGQPVQIIDPESRVFLQIEDLSALDEGSRQGQIAAAKKIEQNQPFDLARGPLLRMKLLKLDERNHVLLRTFHHIVTDGWSQGTFNREFMLLYEAFHQNQADPLQPLSIQYADFALWQRKWLDESLAGQLAYWKQQLAGIPEELALPKDRPRPPRQTFDAGACQISLSPEQTTALKRLSQGNQATLFMTMLAIFATLLQRYSGQDDVVLGSPIANRQEEQLEQLIGFFVNSLVLRVRVNPAQSFSELLSGVRKVALDSYRHQDLPFERLVEELSPQRSLNKTPLYQVLFLLQNAPMQAPALQGLEIEHLPGEGLHTHFDMELQAMEHGDTMGLFWVYNRDLFDRWRIEQMARHYKRLVDAAISEPNLPLYQLEMLEEAEKQQILLEWNSTQREYTAEDALHMAFETQAARTPEAPAVICGSQSLSYQELNERANRLAHYLMKLGVGHETRVGICLERGTEMIAAMLAVLKAGAAYVPLDPKYPAERNSYMLEDSQAKALLTQHVLFQHVPSFAGAVVELDSQQTEIAAMSSQDPGLDISPANLAYVIYTSGSTGKPKGVAICHSSVVTFLHWCRETFLPEELSRVLASTSICFDLSVFEIFAPLSCGSSTVVVGNALELAEATKAAGVTLVNTVPSAMRELVRMKGIPESVRVINLAGEALSGALVREIYQATKAEKVFNLYGPSEDTTYSTYACVPRAHQGAAAPIGKPIANSQVYVLDDWMHVVPVGVTGQLYVAGAGLARGYLNRPALTAESFIPDPFSASARGRMYRTGDLAKWSADGTLEFLGRADHQVKIRGFRIELGEIEAVLQQHTEVEHAVVLAREDGSGEKRLTAYVVACGQQEESARALREYLKGKLPDHMSPAYYVFLDRLPLTENGKVDRKALPNPEQPAAAVYVAPRTAMQQLIAKIWQQALLVERVGLDDNFFDLGGHSLLVARVRFTLREKLGRDVALVDFFTYPTVRTLAQRLEEAEEKDAVSVSDSQLRAARQKAGVLRQRQIALKSKTEKEPV
jgi:amino acid adenylation domain-containing protein